MWEVLHVPAIALKGKEYIPELCRQEKIMLLVNFFKR